jgi:glucose-6-phosphate 1-dehydrogenase
MALTATEVMMRLRVPADPLFDVAQNAANHVRFRLGPDRVSIGLGVRTKEPGEGMHGRASELLMCDEDAGATGPYERLIGDALRGDPTLFARQDSIEAAWRIVDEAIRREDDTEPRAYMAGSWGPGEAAELAADVGGWYDPGVGC